jgi:hypothetical protein
VSEFPPPGQQPPGGQPPPYSYPPPPGGYPAPQQPPPQPAYGYGGGYQPPPAWKPPPRIDPAELRPSRLWYWLSPIPAVIGVVVAVVFIVMLVNRIDLDTDRFQAGSPITVKVDEGKERGIYVQTNVITPVSPGATFGEPACTVREQSSELRVPLDNPSGEFTFTTGNDEFRELYYFEAPRTGNYTVSCEGEGQPLAVAPHFGFKGLVIPILGAIGSFLLGLALTATIAIVTGVKRGRHKKQLQQGRAGRL